MYFVYIITNKWNNVLYTGSTKDLILRVFQHKQKILSSSFTARYNVGKLVWYQQYQTYQEALEQEKRMKRWRRQWKIDLIIENNLDWSDLSLDWDFEEYLTS